MILHILSNVGDPHGHGNGHKHVIGEVLLESTQYYSAHSTVWIIYVVQLPVENIGMQILTSSSAVRTTSQAMC
jgi:hypothetical protein